MRTSSCLSQVLHGSWDQRSPDSACDTGASRPSSRPSTGTQTGNLASSAKLSRVCMSRLNSANAANLATFAQSVARF